MFEAAPNLWLQSFDAPWLLWLMTWVSILGISTFYMAAFALLAFGMRFKPMLGVLLALVLAGAATDALKLGFALPRPSEVDARVLDKGEAGHALVTDGAADTFWEFPDAGAIAAVRAAGAMDYGFVSGHSSAAMAFMLGLLLFFGLRRRWAWAIAIGWALLMGISRMYLGRHFLGDVIGGWAVGALAAWLAWGLVQAIRSDPPRRRRATWSALLLALAALLVASRWLPFLSPESLGQVAGTLLCLGIHSRIAPLQEQGAVRRPLRIVLAMACMYGIDALLAAAWQMGAWPDHSPMAFVFTALGYPLAIMGTLVLSARLGLYRRPA